VAKKPAIDLGDIGNAITAPVRAYGRAVRSYSRNIQSTRPDRFPDKHPRRTVGGRTAFKGGAPRKVTAAAAKAKRKRSR
jgi:hypothetical protein